MNVAVIGCGVRGSIVAALLAGAGVEELSLVDGALITEADLVDNPLIFTPDLNAGKADALVAKLGLIAPSVLAMAFPANLDADNAAAIVAGADVVIDCSDDGVVAEALAEVCAGDEVRLVEACGDYDAAAVTPAQAVEVGARQAREALSKSE